MATKKPPEKPKEDCCGNIVEGAMRGGTKAAIKTGMDKNAPKGSAGKAFKKGAREGATAAAKNEVKKALC
jgi:hypothetical protein